MKTIDSSRPRIWVFEFILEGGAGAQKKDIGPTTAVCIAVSRKAVSWRFVTGNRTWPSSLLPLGRGSATLRAVPAHLSDIVGIFVAAFEYWLASARRPHDGIPLRLLALVRRAARAAGRIVAVNDLCCNLTASGAAGPALGEATAVAAGEEDVEAGCATHLDLPLGLLPSLASVCLMFKRSGLLALGLCGKSSGVVCLFLCIFILRIWSLRLRP
ncbi:uncharacterized protein J3D65DRAFT_351504 [Phyllosticta citribraziliensis]|uniref:Uncharacterized protein n=1 Tax=Phyllosticta citribraziliensis TaxID=989973 RepID=A0ABR1LWD6_9PEZI